MEIKLNGYKWYTINKRGVVTNTRLNKEVSPLTYRKGGVLAVSMINSDGDTRRRRVIDLMLEYFDINDIDGHPLVHGRDTVGLVLDFIDGNQNNLSLDNLRWVTTSEGLNPKYDRGNLEVWKLIEGYTKYWISNKGRVYSTNGDKMLTVDLNTKGYCQVRLWSDNVVSNKAVHRLVAIHFITKDSHGNAIAESPTGRDGLIVNHKDSNRDNPNDWNLEWVTHQENVLHGVTHGNNVHKVGLTVIDLEANETTEHPSLRMFSKVIGITPDTILPYIKNSDKYPMFGRYQFELDEDYYFGESRIATRRTSVYVYDYITGELSEYNSFNEARYVTGVRNTKLKVGFSIIVNGYIFSRGHIDVNTIPNLGLSNDEIVKQREVYLGVPCKIKNPNLPKSLVVK